jgi:hypothetical protein
VNVRRAARLAVLLAASAGPPPCHAQLPVPQPARYLLALDAADARAAWVNPAGLARRVEASIGAHLTTEFPAGSTELRQYGATLGSRGIAFGWEHARMAGGGGANTYVLGLGLGDRRLSVGGARRWYRAGDAASSWDVGLQATVGYAIEVAVTGRDLGSPIVAGVRRDATVIPGAALLLLDGRLRVGGEWVAPTGHPEGGVIHAGATLSASRYVALALRADIETDPEERTIIVALEYRTRGARAAVFGAFPDEGEALGLAALLTSSPERARRRGRR